MTAADRAFVVLIWRWCAQIRRRDGMTCAALEPNPGIVSGCCD
ncbi:MAG TPA: hypothetical protein VFS38_04330 [Actinomycetota bacterium]|nr:hypothetical protein [Actinomycetota bacterium]